MATSRKGRKSFDLALQGGGSHGAFTWGVLDRLLADDSLVIEGISGTSAGALNAGVLATGWADGGRAGARAALRAFWVDVADQRGCFGNSGESPWATLAALNPWVALNPLFAASAAAPALDSYNLDQNAAYRWANQLANSFSPYQLDPFGPNMLGAVLERHVRVDAMRTCPVKLFIIATAVHTGRPRVFSGAGLSLDALLASACLPRLFKAVQIDGEPYWDGGYSGNPALWPLIYHTPTRDIVLVKINSLTRSGTPETAEEIADRVNEITFNAALMAEMRSIAFVRRLVEQGKIDPRRYRALRMHMVSDDESLAPLHASSKSNTSLTFLEALREIGHAAADRWLAAHRADLGKRATLDIEATFLSKG